MLPPRISSRADNDMAMNRPLAPAGAPVEFLGTDATRASPSPEPDLDAPTPSAWGSRLC